MPALTARSTLDSLRRDAKRWLKSATAGDPKALSRLRTLYPGHATPPTLREVQQALARAYGFASWADLKQ